MERYELQSKVLTKRELEVLKESEEFQRMRAASTKNRRQNRSKEGEFAHLGRDNEDSDALE